MKLLINIIERRNIYRLRKIYRLRFILHKDLFGMSVELY